MALHPGEERHLPEEAPVTWGPIRRTLNENEDWYGDLVDHSQDLLCAHDLDGRFLSINPASARLLGYSVDEMLSKPMREFLDPQFCWQFDAYIQEIKRTGESHGMITVMTRAGERRIWEYHNKLRTEEEVSPIVLGIAHDVTEQLNAERVTRESEERFQLFFEHAPAELAMFDSEMRYLHASRRWRTDYGLGDRDLRGVSHYEVFPEIPERWKEAHRRGLAGEILRAEMERFDRADGSIQWIRWEIRPWRNRDGSVGGIVIFTEDVTERRHAEDAIRASELREQERAKELETTLEALRITELRFRTVYERSPIGIALVDALTGRFVQANPKFREITGRSEEQLKRTDVAGITHPEDVERSREYMQRIVGEKRDDLEIRKRFLRPDGSERWVRIMVAPLWLSEEGSRWNMALVEDITEKRQAEEALRQSEERFRVALKHSPIAVFNQDRDLRYTWMYNPQLAGSAHEVIGTNPDDVFGAEEGRLVTDIRRQVLETGVGARHEIQFAAGGKKRYFDTTIEPVWDSTGAVIGLTGASMDVTELREVSEALREAKKKLTEEKLYLEQEIDTELGFGEIVGRSKALQAVMEHVGKVASSDATVLLLGETGTGKELVARALHRLSSRANNSFIKLDCAAIPSGLLESELFGNEKGAFTGAAGRKIGRLELADKGTLFLDEIGEISLMLQPKLLRVLQDQEFERLGGVQTLKVDFRLIAATNRDLAEGVRENEFRSDLYYRLNVFPIRVPPLRERREDISLLVEHFVQQCARRMKKSITSIPKKTMDALMGWEWPGNVRELENFIERSVILTQGSVLVAPLGELKPSATAEAAVDETLEAAERDHILRALSESHGQIGGPRGAAMRLGLKRTTLQSKLKQLGIDPRAARPGAD
ncbi:MAG: sigma 54-interacting transcriptional regulator [Terriglobales bacterium]